MANTFYLEPTDGGDAAIWGPKELRQNQLSKGVLSSKLYDDSGTLKLTVGRAHLDDESGNGVVLIDTIETISIAGITNSRWFAVEMTRTGSTPSFTAVELGADTNPYALPASIDSYYDPEKGGYYRVSTARIVGFGWKATAGTLAGVLNLESTIEGYAGYSTGEIIGHIYRWNYRLNGTYDPNLIGRPYDIPLSSRPSTYPVNGGSSTTWATVDLSAYVPKGVDHVRLWIRAFLVGDSTADVAKVLIRDNGSSETDETKLTTAEAAYTNLTSGLTIRCAAEFIVPCDNDGIIEYRVTDVQARAYIQINGYHIKDNWL